MIQFEFNEDGVTNWQGWEGGIIQLSATGNFGSGSLNLVVSYEQLEGQENPSSAENSYVVSSLTESGSTEPTALIAGGVYRVELDGSTSPEISGMAGVVQNAYFEGKNNYGSASLRYYEGTITHDRKPVNKVR